MAEKFDKEVDKKTKSQFVTIFDMDGKPIVMPGAFKARVKAQMDAHSKRLVGARFGGKSK